MSEPKRLFAPTLELPGSTINTSSLAFPFLQDDLSALGWLAVDSQMWDQDTELFINSPGLPLEPGGSLVAVQDPERTLCWIPHEVRFDIKWDGPPQPALLTVQWSLGAKDILPVQNGMPYDHGWSPAPENPHRAPPPPEPSPPWVRFPTYKGSYYVVGRVTPLSVRISLSAEAKSKVTEMYISVTHVNAKDLHQG